MAKKKAKKQPKYIKNTPSGRRAIAGAKAGKDRIKNPDGSYSSIRTGSYGVDDKTMIVPHVVKTKRGTMRRLRPGEEAVGRAQRTGDFAVAKNEQVATRRSKKFSKRLGKISKKAAKKAGKGRK